MAAITSSTFVIFIRNHSNFRPDERAEQSLDTDEELAVRNALFESALEEENNIEYVEIMRHPIGAETKMREWIKERAYFEKKCRGRYFDDVEQHDQLEQVVCVTQLTIG